MTYDVWRCMFDATFQVTENYGAAIDAADMCCEFRPTFLALSHMKVLRIHRRTKTWSEVGRTRGRFFKVKSGNFGGIDWGEK